MISSSGGRGWCQKGQETGPRSHTLARKGLWGCVLSQLPDSHPSLHHQCLHPCREAPVLNHAKILDPRPPLCTRSPSVPLPSWDRPLARHSWGRGTCFQMAAEFIGARNTVLGHAASAWGSLGILWPEGRVPSPATWGVSNQSLTGKAQTLLSGLGGGKEAIMRLAGGRKETRPGAVLL